MQNDNLFADKAQVQSFGLKDFVARYAKYLPLIILGLLLSYFAAKMKIRYTKETFQSSGTMFIKDEQGSIGKNNDVENLMTNKTGNDLNTEMQYMKSRQMMRRVVKKLGLQKTVLLKGKVKVSLIYGNQPIVLNNVSTKDSLNSFSVDVEIAGDGYIAGTAKKNYNFGVINTIDGHTFSIDKTTYAATLASGQEYILNYSPLENVAASYGVSVGTVGDFTRILSVGMTSESPQLCADVVNTLMEEYMAQNQEDNRLVAEITRGFIDERVGALENELGKIEDDLSSYREKERVINLGAQSTSYLSEIQDAKPRLSEQLIRIGTAQSILDNLKKDQELTNYVPIGILDDAAMQNLFLEYNKKQLDRKKDRENATAKNRLAEESKNELIRLKQTIMEGLSKIILTGQLNANDLEKKINENYAKLEKIPNQEYQVSRFDRDRKTKEELFLFLKKKGEEAAITSVSTLSNSKIVDKALVNTNPISPVKKKIFALFLFLGLVIPALIAYILEVFNDKIRYRDDIQRQTNTPIIAEVGHSDEKQTLVVRSKSRKVIAEQFRMIRTNLQYLVGAKEKFAVLVTSTFSGEGKSFVSTNVAAAIALTGKKVVLLEFDLRKPKVLEGLGMPKGPGISNYVVGKVEIQAIIRPVPNVNNLFVLGCGAIPPNPAELLLEPRVEQMFNYLKENFDVVIVDSAPVGLVTDSMTLSKFVDATLYIVRHKYTLKKQIKLVDELYVTNKLPKLSIVINDVIGSTGGYYGYGGYGYGYGKKTYGYGSGYFEEEQKSFFKDTWTKTKQFFQFWK